MTRKAVLWLAPRTQAHIPRGIRSLTAHRSTIRCKVLGDNGICFAELGCCMRVQRGCTDAPFAVVGSPYRDVTRPPNQFARYENKEVHLQFMYIMPRLHVVARC